jgi:hypothetical protein
MKRARTLVRLGAIGGAGGVAALVAVSATAPATEGCYTHQCDQSSVTIGLAPDGGVVGTGEVSWNGNEVTWESVPQQPAPDQIWTTYAGNQTITFVYGPDAGIPSNATVETVTAWVAAQGDATQANFTLAGGGLAEFSNVDTTSVTVFNDTCQTYFVRIVVVFTVPDAGSVEGGNVDGGTAVDASEDVTDGATSD